MAVYAFKWKFLLRWSISQNSGQGHLYRLFEGPPVMMEREKTQTRARGEAGSARDPWPRVSKFNQKCVIGESQATMVIITRKRTRRLLTSRTLEHSPVTLWCHYFGPP